MHVQNIILNMQQTFAAEYSHYFDKNQKYRFSQRII